MKVLSIVFVLLVACRPAAEKASEPASPSKDVPAPVTEGTVEMPSAAEVLPALFTEECHITISCVKFAIPLLVPGLARTFHTHVVFRPRAANGTVISESFTTIPGEMGHHNPYSGSLWLTREPGSR